MKYYVLRISGDGDVYLSEYTKEKLEEELNNEDEDFGEIATRIESNDLMEAGASVYIFKGDLIVPENKKVIIKRELP